MYTKMNCSADEQTILIKTQSASIPLFTSTLSCSSTMLKTVKQKVYIMVTHKYQDYFLNVKQL